MSLISTKKIKAKKNSFVFVGRLVDEKGVRELLEAFKKVREKYPNATLSIYGDGDIEKYKNLASVGVMFYGETDEPLKVLAENEVFVLPSYSEGLSLSLVEAAMMRKIIIASGVGGNPEVIESGVSGVLVPAQDAKKLAEAMEFVLDKPETATKMAKAARKKYEEEFDIEKTFVESMMSLYNNGKERK